MSAQQPDPFVQYYANESAKESTLQRFAAIKTSVERVARACGMSGESWTVADIGCGAGTQSAMWARDGHRVFGLDINGPLIELGKQRAQQAGLTIDLTTGTATALPWPDASMDICLSPELLEHVPDWRQCIAEATRILRPGGVLYLSTTNKLCPVQHEFDVPGYSWFPQSLKRRYERLAVTTRPELVNHAQYPAVNWFTYFGLRDYMKTLGFDCLDRFDAAALGSPSGAGGLALGVIRATPLTRAFGHMCTPYTTVYAVRKR
ncbi:MAG TPA: class I SAM-dependent methyltransferase [Povalibacter sp.]|nr:class I SAM-dependent methyltransferase [Povalibacter sp.]